MSEKSDFKDRSDGNVEASRGIGGRAGVHSVWSWECYGRDGQLKWVDENRNLVTDEGLNKLLGIMFAGSSAFAAWYVGLVNGASVSPAAGWDYEGIGADFTENEDYTGSRQAFSPGAVSSKSVDNSASKASFTVAGSSAIQVCGAFLAAGPEADTKGDNTGGNTLYCISQFSSGAKSLDPADVLKVTITLTAADA